MANGIVEAKSNSLVHREEFETVYGIIATHRKRVLSTVNNESMAMVWEVGSYVSYKLKTSAWGEGVVRQLSEYIRTKDPTARGWSCRTLYKMVQLYDTYSSASFSELIKNTSISAYGNIVPFETAQRDDAVIMPFEMAQIPKVLFATGWTNHQIIMNRCKTDTERLFYMLYAGRERLENKELIRIIKVDTMNSLLGGKDIQSEVMAKTYPSSPLLFKDKVYLEMLGLPPDYKETKHQKEIVGHMKDFILQMGKDFLFIDDEHRVKVGGKTFKPFRVPDREIGVDVAKVPESQRNGLTWRMLFDSPREEAFYGLGQHQSEELNMKGLNEDLFQYNTKVSVPFVLSTKNYGLLWDSYSYCRFGNPEDYQQLGSAFNFSGCPSPSIAPSRSIL